MARLLRLANRGRLLCVLRRILPVLVRRLLCVLMLPMLLWMLPMLMLKELGGGGGRRAGRA